MFTVTGTFVQADGTVKFWVQFSYCVSGESLRHGKQAGVVVLPTGKYSVDCIIGRGMKLQSSPLYSGGCFFQV